MTTLEQVEKLRAMANISYEEAKAALDKANGNLLDAVIYLEKQGKIEPPEEGGYYSSQKNTSTASNNEQNSEKKAHDSYQEHSFSSLIKQFGQFCLKMVRKGNRNTFEVLKSGEIKAYFPVTILALLLIFAFWAALPLLIVGLFFGFRYRFTGPDFKEQTINDAMDSAAKAAEDLKKSIL